MPWLKKSQKYVVLFSLRKILRWKFYTVKLYVQYWFVHANFGREKLPKMKDNVFFFQEHSKIQIPTHSISALCRGILKRLVEKESHPPHIRFAEKKRELGRKREIQPAESVSPHMHLG